MTLARRFIANLFARISMENKKILIVLMCCIPPPPPPPLRIVLLLVGGARDRRSSCHSATLVIGHAIVKWGVNVNVHKVGDRAVRKVEEIGTTKIKK